MITILCRNPKTAYRHSQTTIDPYFHSVKRQFKNDWVTQSCILCYQNMATTVFDRCKHLVYC